MPIIDVTSTDLICRSPDMTDKRTPFAATAGEVVRVTWGAEGSTTPLKGPCSFWLAKQSSGG
ncbi:hypothetical protein GGI21_006293, partial [Coemansia aciculifera]